MDESKITYRRQGGVGALRIGSAADISVAAELHAAAIRALRDEKATSVRVEMSHTARVDLSSVQILLALQRGLQTSGRLFAVDGPAGFMGPHLDALGLQLESPDMEAGLAGPGERSG